MRRTILVVIAVYGISGTGGVGSAKQAKLDCFAGQVAVGGHCCWAGQTWDARRRACAGPPSECPPGMSAQGEDCTEVGSTSQGSGQADAISAVVQQGAPALRLCYERGASKHPGLSVVSRIGFQVDPRGAARNVTVRNGMDRGLERCLSQAIQRWQFPPPGGAVQVSYSISADSIETAPIKQERRQ